MNTTPSLTNEAKRHRNRVALAARINAEPVRAAIFDLLASAQSLWKAGCNEEARRVLMSTLETLSGWVYCLDHGKAAAPSFDAATFLMKLRGTNALDKSTWQRAAELLSSQDSKRRTLKDLYHLALKLYAMTGGDFAKQEKPARDFPEAIRQYRADCLDTPDNPRHVARLMPDTAARLASSLDVTVEAIEEGDAA